MNAIDFFLLQFKDKESISAAKGIEMKLRCLEGPQGFNDAINEILSSGSKRFALEWVEPLLEKLKPYYKEIDGEFSHPLNTFLEETIKKLNGGRGFMLGKQFDLKNFTKAELEAPCMQWVKIMFERFEELNQAYPGKKVIRVLRVHPINEISDDLAFKLGDMFEDDEWYLGMEFTQFVNYYTKSRAHFEVENEKILPEYAEQMENTLKVWAESETKTNEDHLYWLARNYEFHPLHDEFLKGFIERTLKN